MANRIQTVHSHGKLMITGEYLVLHGAEAFALATKPGQSMELTSFEREGNDGHWIEWLALDMHGAEWMKDSYRDLFDLNFRASDDSANGRLASILKILKQTPGAFTEDHKYIVRTKLEFDRSWGLGSSSTLLANLAKVFEIDPFELLDYSLGGSGYDIAVGLSGKPTRYKLSKPMVASSREYSNLHWSPTFKDRLFFVYQGSKQSTSQEVKRFKSKSKVNDNDIERVTYLTNELINSSDLSSFNEIISEHEAKISECIGVEAIQSAQFSDFRGFVKSLGAWGGDFLLATGEEHIVRSYFEPKGFSTILPYQNLILEQ